MPLEKRKNYINYTHIWKLNSTIFQTKQIKRSYWVVTKLHYIKVMLSNLTLSPEKNPVNICPLTLYSDKETVNSCYQTKWIL